MTTPFPDCPAALTQDQIDQYWSEGWLAFENALDPGEIAAAREAISKMVRRYSGTPGLADYKPPKAGHGGVHSGATYQSRLGKFMMQLEPGFIPEPADPERLELAVRKFMWFEDEAPIFRHIVTEHPRIQGVLGSLLGPEILLYQSMALIKPAHIGSEKPWHQDNAYFGTAELDGVIGTWIALDDVRIENGAMHMLSGGHRLGPLRHHHTVDCEILPGRIDPSRATPVELRAGGMLFFHANTPHQTPPNTSGQRRRALQFHYRRADNPLVPNEEYDRIYAEADGTPASCSAARRLGF